MPRKNKQFPVIDMEKTGKRLKELIEEKGYSVKEIQTILFMSSHQSVYSWYAGITMPSIDNFVALSKLLDVSLDDMIVCHEASEKRIQTFKVEERQTAYYDILFLLQKAQKEKSKLDIESIVEIAQQTNCPKEEVIDIAKKYYVI